MEPVENSNSQPADRTVRDTDAANAAAVGTPPGAGDAYRPGGQDTLDAAMEIGSAILRSGGDVHRVEDSMTRICRAYGAVRIGVFAIPSLITAEVTMPDGETVSRMCRVESAYLHLARLEEINALSRAVCAVPEPPDRVRERLTAIRKLRRIPEWLCYVGGMLGAGGFTVFAGGTWRDGLCSALIGVQIKRHGKAGRLGHELARRICRTNGMLSKNTAISYAELNHQLFLSVMCHKCNIHKLPHFCCICFQNHLLYYIQCSGLFQRFFDKKRIFYYCSSSPSTSVISVADFMLKYALSISLAMTEQFEPALPFWTTMAIAISGSSKGA